MHTNRSRRVSPATIISIVALVFSLAGTGVASIATISVLSKKEKKQTKRIAGAEIAKAAPTLSVKSAATALQADSAGTAGKAESAGSASNAEKLGGLSLRGISQWVLFSAAGTVESSGGVTVTKLGAMNSGRYRASFPTSVANCGLSANAGSFSLVDDSTGLSPAMISVARSSTGPNDVQLQVTRDTGATFDGPGWLTVQC